MAEDEVPPITETQVRENIIAGVYRDEARPPKPAIPTVLRKRAGDLSDEEVAGLGAARDAYEEAQFAYHAEVEQVILRNQARYEQFRTDVLTVCGLTDYAKASEVFSFAWQEGHSSGLQEVLNYALQLVDLLVL